MLSNFWQAWPVHFCICMHDVYTQLLIVNCICSQQFITDIISFWSQHAQLDMADWGLQGSKRLQRAPMCSKVLQSSQKDPYCSGCPLSSSTVPMSNWVCTLYSVHIGHSGMFYEKLSLAQKLKCSRALKSQKLFSTEFNQTWLSFRYIPKDKPCKKVLKSNKGFRRYGGSKG